MSYNVKILHTPYCFQVVEGETVLQAAIRQQIPLAWGCGAGICGMCLSHLVQGEMAYPDGNPLALFEEDIAQGKCLFCVGVPCSDLILEVAELDQ
jgi:ferredoxin